MHGQECCKTIILFIVQCNTVSDKQCYTIMLDNTAQRYTTVKMLWQSNL